MKLGLINSAWAQSGHDTAWGIQRTKQIGFDTIDIFTDPLDIDIRERARIRRECSAADLPIISVCCVAVGLIDFNPSVQRFHMERCRKFIDLCYELEANNLLLVIGEYIWNQEVIPPQEQWQTGVDNCRRLADYAADRALQIALELEPFPLSLVNSADTMQSFLQHVDHPAFHANLDISHLHLAGVPADQLSGLKGRTIHCHISDCDGKKHGDLPPGRGVVDFLPYLKQLPQLDFNGVMSIELEYSPEPAQIEAWVREAHDATRNLMQQAGLAE